jgi:asparagine synthase (glutamine-hydrolysing)
MRQPLLSRLEELLPVSQSRLRVAVRAAAASTAEERLRAWFAPFTEQERTLLAGHAGRPGFTALAGPLSGDVVRRMQQLDCRIWLADNLLERGDRMSMAASLELRPPFLDHHLVELAFRLPTSVKLRHGTTKWVVKEVARRYLPAGVVDRPKAGFRVPLEAWFRTGLRDLAWDRLTGPQSFVASVFDSATVRRLLTSHDSGRRNEEMRLWTLLCLEVWHDVFFGAGRTTSAARSANPADTGRDPLEMAWTS